SATQPPELMEEIRREFGPPPRENEEYGMLPVGELLRIRDQQTALIDGVGALAERLMRRQPWDLCLVAFASCHRAGHKLWDATGADGDSRRELAGELADALRQVYARADAAVGRLVAAAGDGATVLVFS